MSVDRLRAHLQTGFPWHAPEVLRAPCPADEWWSALLAILARAVQRVSGVGDMEARRLVTGVRAAFLDAKAWHMFDDVRPTLERLRDRGWQHIVLSNHVPELASLICDLGLGDLITAVHGSGCTGAEKPIRGPSRRCSPSIPPRVPAG
jgi:putative hydrolase of the HAD superfamily